MKDKYMPTYFLNRNFDEKSLVDFFFSFKNNWRKKLGAET